MSFTGMKETPRLRAARRAVKAPHAAAAAGIVFAVLLSIVILLIEIAVPRGERTSTDWVEDDTRRTLVVIAFQLLPFAGIAFLWFIGVLRDRIGELEDQFFSTVFFGSGLLFIAMAFAAGAALSALLVTADRKDGVPLDDVGIFGDQAGRTLFTVYAMRMAGVFTASSLSLFARLGLLPKWLVVTGIVTTVILLLGTGRVPLVGLVFPAWIFILSCYFLVVRSQADSASDQASESPRPP
jgi:hypothetical protein